MPGDVHHLDTAVAIQEWQQSHHHAGSKPEDRSITARLCDGVLDVFQEVIRQLSHAHHAEIAPKPIRISLERARGLVALWSDGYGIQDGKVDDVLAKSRNIRRSTLKTLSSIADTLLNRLIPLTQISSRKIDLLTVQLAATNAEASYMIHDVIHDEYDGSDASSDGFSDAGPDDSIAEVAEDLKTDAQCLMELDPLFRNPVLDLASHKQKQVLEAIDWAPEKAYCDKVQQRFPRAETPLVETLGKANWARYLRCQEMRNSVETGTQMPANGDKEGDDGTVAASSKYHDSGLGTSLPTASSYAETVMTYGAGDGQKIRIPPLSDEAKKGNPFPCLACGRSVRITNNSTWKRHLYVDLQPYLCLEPQCSQLSFKSRYDWISHLALDHCYQPAWDAVTCPLCFERTEKGKFAVITHLARHLEEISLSALPAYPDEDDDEAFETDSESTNASAVKTPEENAFIAGEDGEVDEVVRCICGFEEMPEPSHELRGSKTFPENLSLEEAAGFFIQCDMCKSWQHGLCVGFYNVDSTPDEYYCERCRPDWHSMLQDVNGNWHSHYYPPVDLHRGSHIRRRVGPTTSKSSDGKRLLRDEDEVQSFTAATAAAAAASSTRGANSRPRSLNPLTAGDIELEATVDEEVLREWDLRQQEDEIAEMRLRDQEELTKMLQEAREEEDRNERLDDAAQREIIEGQRTGDGDDEALRAIQSEQEREALEEEAHMQAYQDWMDEEDEIRREIAVENHLYRLEAEADYRSSDEDDEDDEDEDDEDNEDGEGSDDFSDV